MNMNTGKVAEFSDTVREKLQVELAGRAAFFGITPESIYPVDGEYADAIVIRGQVFDRKIKKQRERLVREIKEKGYRQVMDEVTYTWFNRFMALKFMEANDYLPVKVFSSVHEDRDEPDLLTEALEHKILNADRQLVLDMKERNDDEELYKYLILQLCRYLHRIMPFLFERIEDYTELLFPERLLHTDSIIHDLNDIIEAEDWKEVEVIGWIYQFYIAEKKKKVIGKVVKSEDIPAATQLFTPKWIVKYMVQNSLGALWLATYPHSPLKGKMEYYIEPAEQTDEVKAQLAVITPSMLEPESLILIDPASGSGHILMEAYELFKAIYLERGYLQRDVAKLIIQKNLFGLDICGRAAQLTGFALMMKARADDRRLFECGVKLNVMPLVDSTGFDAERLAQGVNLGDYGLQPSDLADLKRLFEHATTFGSLIQVPEGLAEKLPALKQLSEVTSQDLFVLESLERLGPLVQQAEILAAQYDAVVANPPYMGTRVMPRFLKVWCKKSYPASCADLFSCFIERAWRFTLPNGLLSLVTLQNWMFLTSFTELRSNLISDATIRTLTQVGFNTFPTLNSKIALGCMFSVSPAFIGGYLATYVDCNSAAKSADKHEVFLQRGASTVHNRTVANFDRIPGKPIAYWATNRIVSLFETEESMSTVAVAKQGMATTDNTYYLRHWAELSVTDIVFPNGERGSKFWFPYNKGGDFRRWYGPGNNVVRYTNDGEDLIEMVRAKYPRISDPEFVIKNRAYYFREGVTWTDISLLVSARYLPPGYIFDTAGPMAFFRDEQSMLLALSFLNTHLSAQYRQILNPSLHFTLGDFEKLPFPRLASNARVERDMHRCIEITHLDWDAYERSWDFQSLPILTASSDPAATLESSYVAWIEQNKDIITEMKRLEEENNRLFIDAYGLADELTPEVPIEQITLTMNPAYRYPGTKKKPLTEDERWARFRQDTMKELISYAVGCMFGRYSPDRPGLILANQGENLTDFRQKVGLTGFLPDAENIIPILDDEYFTDDIVTRFREFLTYTFGDEKISENLDFVADAISSGKSRKSSEEIIRDYFLRHFFKDHCRTYKKRPIYWLFTSGKKKAFNALIYMHRYDKTTLARMRQDYLHELESKFQARLDMLEKEEDERKSVKERKKLRGYIEEMIAYDEVLKNRADEYIEIDLDDGVKVNYGKFGGLVQKI